jgi:glycosyltransferase involved in cell wall biosynthesis
VDQGVTVYDSACDMRPLVSVIVPTYNEELVIDTSLRAIIDELRNEIEHQYRWEIIVVDDGSQDRTVELVDVVAAAEPRVRVLRHAVNFRLGQALRFAIGQSRGDYVVTMDADLTYSPDHIGRMLEALRVHSARIAVASPYMDGGRTTAVPPIRRLMSKTANRMLARSSGGGVATLTGLVRAYDGEFIRSLNLKAMGPEINTEILYKARVLRSRVVEVPAHLDWTGQSERVAQRRVSLKVSPTSKLYLFASFLFRPLAFFVVPGVAVLALAVWTIGSVMLDSYRRWRELPGGFNSRMTQAVADVFEQRPHSFIVGGVLLMVAVQLIGLGLLAAQAKRYFEEIFHQATQHGRLLGRGRPATSDDEWVSTDHERRTGVV